MLLWENGDVRNIFRRMTKPEEVRTQMKLIVGLGNPGKQYDQTRHNIGFEVIDLLSDQLSIPLNQSKFKGFMGLAIKMGKRYYY